MGRQRWTFLVPLAWIAIQSSVLAQQAIHWEANLETAKRTAAQSNRLVLVMFTASWCQACHGLENDLQNQTGAPAALEANFVPVKLNTEFYLNTAKQYGVTVLPTTVILAPTAQGEVLDMIPRRMPVDEYLAKLNQVASDAKRRNAALRWLAAVRGRMGMAEAAIASMHQNRVLRKLGVPFQRHFDFFLRRRGDLPCSYLLLEHLCPGAVEVHLFAGTLVDDFEAVSLQHRQMRREPTFVGIRSHVDDDEGVGVIKHVHGVLGSVVH